MCLIENDEVVETVSTYAADYPFAKGILPWGVRRDSHFLYVHGFHLVREEIAVGLVVVAEDKARSGVPGKGLNDLESGPLGAWIRCDVEMNDFAGGMLQDDGAVEGPERGRGHAEEVNGVRVNSIGNRLYAKGNCFCQKSV